MTFARYTELSKAWKRVPPLNHLVAAFMGYEAPSEVQAEKQGLTKEEYEEQQLQELMNDFMSCGGEIA